jgi:hypothetical protein
LSLQNDDASPVPLQLSTEILLKEYIFIICTFTESFILLPLIGEAENFDSFYFFLIFFFETGSYYVAQVGLEFTFLLPHPPKSWDYKCVPGWLL